MSKRARDARKERRAAARRLAPVGTRMPTEADSVEAALRFFEIARTALSSRRRAADLAEDYFGVDPQVRSARLWYFAAVGPLFVGVGLRKLNRNHLTPDDVWVLDHMPGDEYESAVKLACQTVVLYLNDDTDTMHDLIQLRFREVCAAEGMEAAHDALFAMVTEHIVMLARLIDAGAYPRGAVAGG